MPVKPEFSPENRAPRSHRASPFLLAAALVVVVTIGVAVWWNRSAMLQLGVQQFLERASLLEPKLSGLRFGFDSADLSAMEFGVETGAGRLAVSLENVRADYSLGTPSVESIVVGRARLRFAYRPAEKPGPEDGINHAAIPFPLDRLTVENLDVQIDTPWGLSQFTGRLEVKRGEADLIVASFQDAAQSVRVEVGPGFRSARVTGERTPNGRVFELNVERPDQPDKQVSLHTGAGPFVEWLTTSSLVPETLRAKMVASGLIRLRSGLSLTDLDLTAGTHDNFSTVQGRALLTRESRYVASVDLSMAKQGTVDADAYLDMPVMEAFELLKPWLPEMTREWRAAAGKVQGNMNLRWQSNRVSLGTAHVKISDLALVAGGVRFGGGFIDVDSTDLTNRSVTVSAEIPTLEMGKGIAARNLIARARYLGHALTVERAALSMFGGVVEVLPATVDFEQRPIPLTLRMQNVDLSQLLASLNYKELSGTGTVNGELPLRLSLDAIELQDGTLTGTRPGVLRYQGPAADQESLAFKALRNLGYQRLQATINYRPSGDYHLGFRLEGSNPEVLSGHPLAFNLNVRGQLPELLQRGILAGDFDRPILEQAQHRSADSARAGKPRQKSPAGDHQPKPPRADRRSQ